MAHIKVRKNSSKEKDKDTDSYMVQTDYMQGKWDETRETETSRIKMYNKRGDSKTADGSVDKHVPPSKSDFLRKKKSIPQCRQSPKAKQSSNCTTDIQKLNPNIRIENPLSPKRKSDVIISNLSSFYIGDPK